MTRDELEAGVLLTQRVSLLTVALAEKYGVVAPVERLCRRGLLARRRLVFRPLMPGAEPLAVHRPGEPFPDALAREVANRAAARIAGTPVARVAVYQPTRKAYAVWGDAARKKGNPFSFGHDHLTTVVFLRLPPEAQRRWVLEPVTRPTGPELFEKIPDAALVDGRGRPLLYVESVGAYSPDRIWAIVAQVDENLRDRAGRPNAGIVFW